MFEIYTREYSEKENLVIVSQKQREIKEDTIKENAEVAINTTNLQCTVSNNENNIIHTENHELQSTR